MNNYEQGDQRANFESAEGAREIRLDFDRWAAFLEALDAPARDLPRLRALLNESPPWDRDSA